MLAGPLGDETVIMNLDKGLYHGLNVTGTRLWALLIQPVTVSHLCAQLTAEFAVPPDQCEQDVIAFVADLVTRGLVEVVADAAS